LEALFEAIQDFISLQAELLNLNLGLVVLPGILDGFDDVLSAKIGHFALTGLVILEGSSQGVVNLLIVDNGFLSVGGRS
jgi:hypothetical protein